MRALRDAHARFRQSGQAVFVQHRDFGKISGQHARRHQTAHARADDDRAFAQLFSRI